MCKERCKEIYDGFCVRKINGRPWLSKDVLVNVMC